ncbi:hypothetical protein [Edaphobacter aggregans]|uniref:hypothetical protein n=1 Tax=Edaphobacter aggregans TaxID=570835 RepID=UPI000555B277|nr:hypothetical protein [Edaphobacter aggregans]
MDITRFTQRNDNSLPFDSTEFDAGYLARLSGEPQCLGATPGWRAGWADADELEPRNACDQQSELTLPLSFHQLPQH